VLAQTGLYVAVYGRLVRGRWGVGKSGRLGIDLSARTPIR